MRFFEVKDKAIKVSQFLGLMVEEIQAITTAALMIFLFSYISMSFSLYFLKAVFGCVWSFLCSFSKVFSSYLERRINKNSSVAKISRQWKETWGTEPSILGGGTILVRGFKTLISPVARSQARPTSREDDQSEMKNAVTIEASNFHRAAVAQLIGHFEEIDCRYVDKLGPL